MGAPSLGIFKEVSDDNTNRKNSIPGVSGTIEEIFFLRLAFGVSHYRWHIRTPALPREMTRSLWGRWKVTEVFTAPLLRDCWQRMVCTWQPANMYWASTQRQGLLNWKSRVTKTVPAPTTLPSMSINQGSHVGLMTQIFFQSSSPSFMSEFYGEHRKLFPQSPLEQWGTSVTLYYSFKKTKHGRQRIFPPIWQLMVD